MRLFFGENPPRYFFPGDICHFRFSILQDTDLGFHEIIDNFFYATKLQVLNVETTTSRLFGISIKRVCSK